MKWAATAMLTAWMTVVGTGLAAGEPQPQPSAHPRAAVATAPVAAPAPQPAQRLAAAIQSGEQATAQRLAAGDRIAELMNRVLGTALSPIFGMAVLGAWDHAAHHPGADWSASPYFYGPLLLLLLCIALKDVGGVTLGPLKQVIDAAEVAANQAAGLVGLAFTVSHVTQALKDDATPIVASALDALIPPAQAASVSSGGADPAAGLVAVLLVAVLAAATYAVVWLVGHAFTVLVFLNPCSPADPFLKAARLGLLGVMAVLSCTLPAVAIAACLVLFALAWYWSGFFLRFCVYGSVMAWDLLLRRGRGDPTDRRGVLAFVQASLPGVARRTMVRLDSADGQLQLRYRRWWLGQRKQLTLDGVCGLRHGLIYASLFRPGATAHVEVLHLPPRYLGHEQAVAQRLGLTATEPSRLLHGLTNALAMMRELMWPLPQPDKRHPHRTVAARVRSADLDPGSGCT